MPGSPVFLVQLCAGARHLEVQVVGDGQGQAIALGGRDCSTQRRFQKIFEEGPPIVAPDDVFVDMMKSAVELCKSLNYRSAGTIEYLYQPDTKKYYFLELNPRLQARGRHASPCLLLPPSRLSHLPQISPRSTLACRSSTR